MALFQIFKGNETELNQVKFHAGYAYFCVDSGKMFIDISNEGPRIPISGEAADGLIVNGEFVDADQFVNIESLSTSGVLIGDGSGGVTGISIPNNAIVIGDSTNGIKAIEVGSGGVLTAVAGGIPAWTNILPVNLGGTGRSSHLANAVLVGNGTGQVQNIQAETGGGAFYATSPGGAPQFGVLPVAQGGTGAATDILARANLNVYSKAEVDTLAAQSSSKAYNTTLAADAWVENEEIFTYTYGNTALRCGVNGDVPPIIAPIVNKEEYIKIDRAIATQGEGIVFEIAEKPEQDIEIVIVDI